MEMTDSSSGGVFVESFPVFSLLTSWILIGVGIFLCLRLVRIVFRRLNPGEDRRKTHDDLLVDVLRTKVEKARVAESRLIHSRRAYASLARLYQTVTEHVPLGMVVLDAAMKVQFANPMARDILGPLEGSDEGRDLPDGLREVVVRLKQTQTRGRERVDVFLNRQWWTLELDLVPLPDSADLLTIQDKTEIRQLEQSLQANRELTLMGEMAAGVAHEVKNVLAIVEGRAQLMALTGDVETHRDVILKETSRLLAMVKRFMESSKREALDASWFEAGPWFEELAGDWVSRGEEERVAFENVSRPDLRMFGDPALLSVLVENLVMNALEACGEMVGEEPLVRVRLEETGQQLVLTVTDRGPGFSDDIMRKVFLPFVTSKADGHGLGLFHSRKIVLAHRGVMEIDAEPTRVRCIFPLTEDRSLREGLGRARDQTARRRVEEVRQ